MPTPPTFSANAPQWLLIRNGAGPELSIGQQAVPIGPFKFGGNLYFLAVEIDPNTGAGTIVAYMNQDGLKSQPATRIVSAFADAPAQPRATLVQTYWDGSSPTVYLVWVSGANNGHLFTSTFTMTANGGTFGVESDTGVALTNLQTQFYSLRLFPLATGDLVVLWDRSNGFGNFKYVIQSGGVWGAPVDSGSTDVVLGAALLKDGSTVGLMTAPHHGFPGVVLPITISYRTIKAGALATVTTTTQAHYINNNASNICVYLAASDTLCCAIQGFNTNSLVIEYFYMYSVAQASGAAAITQTLIYDDAASFYDSQQCSLIADPNGNLAVYFNIPDHQVPGYDNGGLFVFSAAKPTGPWSAPAIAYDPGTNNTNPPDTLSGEFAAFNVSILPDGRAFVTFDWGTGGAASVAAVASPAVQLAGLAAQLCFAGVRRLPRTGPLEDPARYDRKTFSYTLNGTLATPAPVNGIPVILRQTVVDYDFELYQVQFLYTLPVGITLPEVVAAVMLYDQAHNQVSNVPMLDAYLNGRQGSRYENGGLQCPLRYKQNTQIRIDLYNLTLFAPIGVQVLLVGKQLFPKGKA